MTAVVRLLGPALTLTGLLVASRAEAHGGVPAVAWVDAPMGVGTVVDDSFTFTWVDFDMPIPTGTATIDFHYAARRPPAYLNGDIHPLLEGEPIVSDIWEKDPTNEYTWDTSQVPAGSYYIWSIVIEPPEEMMSPQIVSFSPGILTVAHPGDEVHPAILLTTPESSFQFADTEHLVKWLAFDPDGTGRVRIEAGTSSMGLDLETIAEDIAADEGQFLWDTSALPEGEYQVRATLTDARGLSFTTYAQFVLEVSHAPSQIDAGVADAGGAPRLDAGVVADAGPQQKTGEPDGCRCLTPGRAGSGWLALLGLGLGLRAGSARRRPASRRGPR